MADTPTPRWVDATNMSDVEDIRALMARLGDTPALIMTMTDTGEVVVASNIPWPHLDIMQDALSDYVRGQCETN